MRDIKTNAVILAAAMTMGAGAAFAGGEVVYQNDFSSRTSTLGVPTPRWQSQAYVDGDLLKGGGATTFTETSYQDGWYRGQDNSSDRESWLIVSPLADSDDPSLNRCAIFISSSQTVTDPAVDHRTHVVQSIGNVITNGILRMQVDLHAAEYNSSKNNNFFFGPLYKKYLNVRWGATLPKYAGYFGFNLDNAVGKVRNYYYGGDGTGGVASPPVYVGSYKSAGVIGNWYRFVVDFDVANNVFSGTVYDMGSTQPELTTPNGAPMDTLPAVHFYSDVSEDTGGIAGIVMRDCGSVSTSRRTDANRAPAADNIKLWWRASGTDFTDDDLFYENDFAVRRSRALVPTPPTTATFETKQETVDDIFTAYKVNEINDLPGSLLLVAPTYIKEVQPYGIDGWRRINGSSSLEYSVARHTKDAVTNQMIAVTGRSGYSNRFGLTAQNLGGKITSGQMMFQFDTRTPDKMRATSTPYIYGMLAPESYLNSGTDEQQSSLYAGRSGFLGADNSSTFQFATVGSAGTVSVSGAVSSHWYRVVQIVDLDTKTFDTAIYAIGDKPVDSSYVPADDPVYTRNGVACKNQSLADISCFAFYIGGAGGETGSSTPVATNEAGIVYLDNIRVQKRATSGDDWTAVYFNDFSNRIRYDMPKNSLAFAKYPDMPGEDGWVMRNLTSGKPTVFGGENPALGLDNAAGGDYLWSVQSIGESITSGSIRFRADIKPPREWATQHGAATAGSIMLGNDVMFMGNRYPGVTDFLTQFQIRFGIGPQDTTVRHYRMSDNKAFYYAGSGIKTFFTGADQMIDWNHWYRFEAVSDVRKGTFGLKVYDMGTSHPDLETPTPQTAFASVDNVPYRTSLADGWGLSAICASILGNEKETPWVEVDSGLCYIDNIQITRVPFGLMIRVQ